MAFIRDLDRCEYLERCGLPPMLAVGWLDRGRPFVTGDPGPEVRARLNEYVRNGWQPVSFRGFHSCCYCDAGDSPNNGSLGSGADSIRNLLVPGRGVTYAAPEGILHYIDAHGYCPPAEFCDAIIASPPVESLEYFAALRDLGWVDRLAPFYRPGPIVNRNDDPAFREQLRRVQADLYQASRCWPVPVDLALLARPQGIPPVFWTFDPAYGPLKCHLQVYTDAVDSSRFFDWSSWLKGAASNWPLVGVDSIGMGHSSQPDCLRLRDRVSGQPLPVALADDGLGDEGFVLLSAP